VNRYFEVQGKSLLGTATPEELAWMKAQRADEAFVKQLETFGNFVHGTHVTGVSTKDNADARAIPIKMIATEPPAAVPASMRGKAANDFMIMLVLNLAAKNNLALVKKTAVYADKKGARVANCSFGASTAAVAPQVKKILEQLNDGSEPTEADVRKWSKYLVDQLVAGSDEFTDAATNTLFVIAAGNDGANNDVDPAWPANAKKDNTITVAATLATQSLATFSNYGATMVDVGAPGVVINSTIPGDQYLELSGTSMAAPFVTDVAGIVASKNPALTPKQIRDTLIATVDVKDFLKGKVTSSGIVNKDRAARAAELSLTMPLADATAKARQDIADVAPLTKERLSDADITPVPLPNPFQ
jgi:subtilisin family serine protease